MRRVILCLTVMGATLILATGVALAAVIQCTPGNVCYGTDLADQITGTEGSDEIRAGVHDDRVDALGGDDQVWADLPRHSVGGFPPDGKDWVEGGDGNDFVNGGPHNDLLNGGEGDDYLQGENDHDELNGGSGDDALYGDILSTGICGLGDLNNDDIDGDSGEDFLAGGAGSDRLYGSFSEDKIDARDPPFCIWQTAPDIVRGGPQSDLIYAHDSIPGTVYTEPDIIDCGPGVFDDVFYDNGIDTVAADCEGLHPR